MGAEVRLEFHVEWSSLTRRTGIVDLVASAVEQCKREHAAKQRKIECEIFLMHQGVSRSGSKFLEDMDAGYWLNETIQGVTSPNIPHLLIGLRTASERTYSIPTSSMWFTSGVQNTNDVERRYVPESKEDRFETLNWYATRICNNSNVTFGIIAYEGAQHDITELPDRLQTHIYQCSTASKITPDMFTLLQKYEQSRIPAVAERVTSRFSEEQLVNHHLIFTRKTVQDHQQATYMFARLGSVASIGTIEDLENAQVPKPVTGERRGNPWGA